MGIPDLFDPDDTTVAPPRSLASGLRMSIAVGAERIGGAARAEVEVAVRLMAATLAARTGAVVLAEDLVVPIDVPGRGMEVIVDLEDERAWPLVRVEAVATVRGLEIEGVDRVMAVEVDRACVGGIVGLVVVGLVIDLAAIVCRRPAFDVWLLMLVEDDFVDRGKAKGSSSSTVYDALDVITNVERHTHPAHEDGAFRIVKQAQRHREMLHGTCFVQGERRLPHHPLGRNASPTRERHQ